MTGSHEIDEIPVMQLNIDHSPTVSNRLPKELPLKPISSDLDLSLADSAYHACIFRAYFCDNTRA